MSLLQKLKDVRTVKQNYFILQRRFYAELSKRFPHLMNSDMAKVANKLEDELTTMLCVSLKYNSIKIPLPARSRYSKGDKTFVNVQRGEPGFYYPRSERGTSDIQYMNLKQYIKDNGDMYIKYTEEDYSTKKKTDRDELLVALSELKAPKHAPRIHQEKLDAYFKLLKEVMGYRPKFLCYTSEGYSRGIGIRFNVDNLQFSLRDKSFDVRTFKKKDGTDNDEDEYSPNYGSYNSKGFRYKQNTDDILRMLNYSKPGTKCFDAKVHDRLKYFTQNYDIIIKRLEDEEFKKRKAFKTCTGFIKQLRVHTLPFKVLGELQK